MINLKFHLDFLPVNAHYNNLRYFFKKEIWTLIVQNIREAKNYQCEYCYRTFDKNNTKSLKYLHCHELWNFDYENQRQILIDILLLCNNCHNCQHINLASLKDWDDKAIAHYKKVNHLSNSDFNEIKREGYLFRKNYIDKNLISRKELDEVQVWFFKMNCDIAKYFSDKELGELIQEKLVEISNMNF